MLLILNIWTTLVTFTIFLSLSIRSEGHTVDLVVVHSVPERSCQHRKDHVYICVVSITTDKYRHTATPQAPRQHHSTKNIDPCTQPCANKKKQSMTKDHERFKSHYYSFIVYFVVPHFCVFVCVTHKSTSESGHPLSNNDQQTLKRRRVEKQKAHKKTAFSN